MTCTLSSLEHVLFVYSRLTGFDRLESFKAVREFVQQQTHSVRTATINPGLPQNSIAFTEPKTTPKEVGREPRTKRQETHGQKEIKGQVSTFR